jgi:hypothetical protein
MAQKTNLNVSPYFDDFDSSNNFLKVLFKPGFPVQSRELTTSQSILQNQIEDFASHMFKEGSVVIPGNVTFDDQYYAIKLNSTQFGVDLSLYIDKFLGKTIRGQSSGSTAKIVRVVFPKESAQVDYITLYLKYIGSDNNFEFNTFIDGEILSATENVVYGNTTISSGTPFATIIGTESSAIGSSASIDKGIYFIRGHFVEVGKHSIILDYYTNTPSYRVGLKITESIISAKDDSSLYDNAKGFSNYASPGADRLKISAVLSKKELTDTNDNDFVELFRVKDGKILKVTPKTEYNKIRDYLAKRTFEESGSYSVDPFEITLQESLNDRLGNNGAFYAEEITEEGNTPTDNLACLKIESGKVYAKGYDIEVAHKVIDVEKPRETEKNDTSVSFSIGNLLRVNTATFTPKFGSKVDLSRNFVGSPDTIGEATVYSYNLTDDSYKDDTTTWDLRLFDIQTYTKITVNTNISVNSSYFVEGNSSGASGYVVSNSSDDIFHLNQTSGSFQVGETIKINGIDSNFVIKTTRAYNISDVRSVFQNNSDGFGGSYSNFTANVVQEKFDLPGGIRQVVLSNSGTTMTCPGRTFQGIKVDDTFVFQDSSGGDPRYRRVTNISADLKTLTLESANNPVSGIFGTAVSDGQYEVSLVGPVLRGTSSLYVPLFDENVADIDVSQSRIKLKDQITNLTIDDNISIDLTDLTSLSGGSLSDTEGKFEGFDQERYALFPNAGATKKIVALDSDFVNISNNQVDIGNLTPYDGPNNILTVTIEKLKIKSKVKNYVRNEVLDISKSKLKESGTDPNNSLNDGLTYNEYYGLRVQDHEISLNVPDVSRVLAVYESLSTADPTLDRLSFSSTSAVQSNAIVGEKIIGEESNAIATLVNKSGGLPANTLEIIYLTEERLSVGETVKFEESNITTNVESYTKGSYRDITSSYRLDSGQRDQYYDYSRIVRETNTSDPSKKLKIIYDCYQVPANDAGDLFTVNSYGSDRFTNDIPLIGKNKVRATDVLDFRPRVPEFNPTVTTNLSPFVSDARTFTLGRVLSSDESSALSYDFYLPRIDKIYIDTLGNFVLDKGKSSKTPQEPQRLDDYMHLATLELPAYLYSTSDATLTMVDNRRYTMRDIGNLEDRIENLERLTSLSLLESNAQSIQVKDSEGRDRFKSGFFADDFKDASKIDDNYSMVTIDPELTCISPIVSRKSLDSLLASSQNVTTQDLDLSSDFQLLDPAIQKTGRLLTLAYKEVDWLEQPLATRVENVNPFNVVLYVGNVELTPRSDTWVRTTFMPNLTVSATRNESVTRRSSSTAVRNRTSVARVANWNRRGQTVQRGTTTRSSTSTSVSSRVQVSTSRSTATVLRSRSAEIFMRSRNVDVKASNLKPRTRYYQFLDGNSGVDFLPKMLEIANDTTLQNSGATAAFNIGETVVGTIEGREILRFRLAHPRHKEGPFNNPESFYNANPYASGVFVDKFYSSTSKVLNIDTFSMAQNAQGDYYGYATVGMKLKGQSSGAEAYVKDLRLISDNYGDLNATFFLRDPNRNPSPPVRINTGNKVYRLTSSSTNKENLPGGTAISSGETSYDSRGTLEVYQRVTTVTTVRRRITTVTSRTTVTRTRNFTQFFDPLAQTFTVGGNVQVRSEINTEEDANGVFLTSVDLFFGNADESNAPLRVEIRTVELGTPTLQVVGKSVTVLPTKVDVNGNVTRVIQTSETGDTATNIKFPEPIFLEPGREYALVLISENSDAYEMWTAKMGEKTVNSATLPDVDSVVYTQQFALGSLFKSQNGSIWTADQYQDLKFKLYKAEFTSTEGTAYFHNPPLDSSNGYVQLLEKNPITTYQREGYIDIDEVDSSESSVSLRVGRKLAANNNITGSAVISDVGSKVSTIGIVTAGENYYANLSAVPAGTTAISGLGTGLVLDISTNSSGNITAATINTGAGSTGFGYKEGDIVTINTSEITGINTASGRNSQFSITGIGNTNRLYISNIQGEFSTNPGKSFSVGAAVSYYNSSGSVVSLASTTILDYNISGEGNIIKVNHFDHGMYHDTNKVVLKNVQSTVPPTILNVPLTSTDNTTITLSDVTEFMQFEGVDVDSDYPGYIKIGNEIIKYESSDLASNILSGITRGIDGTVQEAHSIADRVEKYEFNGISLRRINNVTHNVRNPIEMDSYNIEIDLGPAYGTDRNGDQNDSITGDIHHKLAFNTTNMSGGDSTTATENIIYTGLRPTYDIVTPGSETAVSGRIRSVTGTSVDGSESPFIDSQFEFVSLNLYNPLTTPRIVCSVPNEQQYLDSLPRNKSFTTTINFRTTNKNLSPYLNLDTAFTEFFSSRFNKPVTNYITDSRVNTLDQDPHAAVYYSNLVELANPATSLKVIVSAYKHESADFRVLYSLIRPDSEGVEQAFELFPGYDNLRSGEGRLEVIDSAKNSGLPDMKVPSSLDGEYLEYEFSADNLGLFVGFGIKIVMSGTNQAEPPRLTDVRAIAVR